MAWTKKTGTLPDKIKTLLVVDTSDSNKFKDLGDSGVSEGAGITLDTVNVVKVDRTTGGWGFGIYTNDVSFVPGTITFTDVGAGKPKWLNSAAADGTVIMLFNRFRSGDTYASRELLQLSASNNPMIATDATPVGLVKASDYTVASTGTTTIPADTAIGLAMHARRSASNLWKYFYGTKSGGTFAQEGSSGSINDAGGQTTINKLGTNALGQAVEYELFMIAVAPADFLSGAEMDSILSDPLGTLVNTGGGGGAKPWQHYASMMGS